MASRKCRVEVEVPRQKGRAGVRPSQIHGKKGADRRRHERRVARRSLRLGSEPS